MEISDPVAHKEDGIEGTSTSSCLLSAKNKRRTALGGCSIQDLCIMGNTGNKPDIRSSDFQTGTPAPMWLHEFMVAQWVALMLHSIVRSPGGVAHIPFSLIFALVLALDFFGSSQSPKRLCEVTQKATQLLVKVFDVNRIH